MNLQGKTREYNANGELLDIICIGYIFSARSNIVNLIFLIVEAKRVNRYALVQDTYKQL